MSNVHAAYDWRRVAYLCLVSRALDIVEEESLLPARKILYQFSSKGHELAQILVGSLLNHKHDAVNGYYRSRPMLLTLGLTVEDAFAGPLAKAGGINDGRDIGVVYNLPSKQGPKVLPMAGGVGSQYTPSAGWAQAICYRRDVLKDPGYRGAMAVVLGGDGSVATNGFWAALTMATTLDLPILFYIEDNGYGLSVPGKMQTPGANIADNLKSFGNLFLQDGDGTDPAVAAELIAKAVSFVRERSKPALLRLTVPRLCGHSGQDTQAYKSAETIAAEKSKDPLPKLQRYLVPAVLSEKEWQELAAKAKREVDAALEAALQRNEPQTSTIRRHVFTEHAASGAPELQLIGGLAVEGHKFPPAVYEPQPEPTRISMVTAIRKTLAAELKSNPKFLIFGEDIAAKGGVHGVTAGLQDEFGAGRVFDTSLSEEGIIGRAVGMALAGLMPMAEIQFRKYADPATEQINDCGTIRWRTANKFAAPMVMRVPGGFLRCGDPWHSACDEAVWTHSVGWQLAFPSNATDAVGLLRAALRGNDPTIFFEHRALLDGAWARRPYPGDNFVVPFGKGNVVQAGTAMTVVTWGAMVERCEEAAKAAGIAAEIIDLRSLVPWDKEMVLESVKKTRRALIVHEDRITGGFGAEISATITESAFFSLDAPVKRVAVADIPIPYNVALMNATVPSADEIRAAMVSLLEF